MEGFSYNGKHSSEFGVQWTPNAKSRGDFFADFEVIASERTWVSGGEFCKARVKTRTFEIDCYYEQITYETREKMIRWLDRRTSGKLIFDNRSWAAYFVRPTKKIEVDDYLQTDMGKELYSGTFTITFSAYDPFAELLFETLDECEDVAAKYETGLIPSHMMPPEASINDTTVLVYNPGTETGHSIIRVSGETGSADLVIQNVATGDKCVLRSGLIADDADYYEIDSKTGRVVKHSYGSDKLDFAFHDEGYITFSPSEHPVYARINTTRNSRIITADADIFTEDNVGKYIFLNGQWRYIGNVLSSNQAEINAPMDVSTTEETCIVDMNVLTISKGADAKITSIEIICKAEVR